MNESILMTGCAADAEAALVLKRLRGEMETHFPSFFRARIRPDGFCPPLEEELAAAALLLRGAEEIAGPLKPACMIPCGRGGVLKALWDLGETLSSGMEITIRKIPIRQETVEICEYCDIDPYYADTSGSLLIAVHDPDALLVKLRGARIPAAVIGAAVPGKARLIRYPGHVRCLDKPRKYL